MAVSWTRFSWWLWSGKEKEPVSNGVSLNSSADYWVSGLRDVDSVKFSNKSVSSPNKVKRKWHNREERRVDKQYSDAVVVASGGEACLSGSEDGPDWSIGWVEPHGPDFRSDEENDDGFAVLVPCYRISCKELAENSNNQLISAIKNLPNEFSSEGKNYKNWLSSV